MTDQEKQSILMIVHSTLNDSSFQSNINILLLLFIKKRCHLYIDSTLDAPAAIDMSTFEIRLNDELVGLEIIRIAEIRNAPLKDIRQMTRIYVTFLMLHELGHFLYSAGSTIIQKYILPTIPMELSMFVLNVIEDVYIQAQFLRDYPSKYYKEAMIFGETYSQSLYTIDEYGKHVRAGETLSIRNKLYYFILRGFNINEKDINMFFDDPNHLGWQNDTVAAFDQAQTFFHKEDRCAFACQTVVPLVFRDLLEKIQSQGISDSDMSSLLESDKIYQSDSENQSNEANTGSGQDQKSSQGQNDAECQKNDNSSHKDQQSSSNKSDQKDGTVGKNDSSTSSEQNSESKSKDQRFDSVDNSTKDSLESNNSENTAVTTSDSSVDQDTLTGHELTRDQIDKLVSKACEELNKTIHEPHMRDDVSSKDLKTSEADKTAQRLYGSGCSGRALDQNMSDGHYCAELYRACAPYLEKIFNLHNEVEHYLEDGDIDTTTIVNWYTERDTHIFKNDLNIVQNRDIVVTFVLDISGSMSSSTAAPNPDNAYGRLSRYQVCVQMISALTHAFEDVGIKTSIYVFNSQSTRIKTFDEPALLDSNYQSNIYNQFNHYRANGCTDPSGAFQDILDNPEYSLLNDDTAKILLFLTDGYLDSDSVDIVTEQIKLLIEREWFIMPIGIDFDKDDLKHLQEITGEAIAESYSSKDLVHTLGEKIYNTIVDNFILVK